MKSVFVLAAVAAALALTPVKPAFAQIFAGLGSGLGAALGHGEEESSIGESSQTKNVALSEHPRTHREHKAHSRHIKAAPVPHNND